MNRIVQIKMFNDILDQFFGYLESNFPIFKSDIIITKSSVDFLRKNNPRLVVEQFMKYTSPYSKQIFSCDETFFINFEKNFTKTQLTTDNILAGLKIKNMWISPDISDKQKAYIWLYFQKLIKAGEKVLLL